MNFIIQIKCAILKFQIISLFPSKKRKAGKHFRYKKIPSVYVPNYAQCRISYKGFNIKF